MGIYHMLVNDAKKEYLYFDKYNLNVKSFVSPTIGMIIAWVIQYSDWRGDKIRILDDSGGEDEFYEICEKWKNREDDFITEYRQFIGSIDGFDQYDVELHPYLNKAAQGYEFDEY